MALFRISDGRIANDHFLHQMKGFPSWSPHLNPIEYCFNIWKGQIKREIKTNATTLREQIAEASKAITPRYVERCLDHVYKYYTGCIQMKDLDNFEPLML